MANQEDEDLKMALRMSMQHESPEPKRSRPGGSNTAHGAGGDGGGGGVEETGESPEMRNRRLQRELRAAAAEKRMMAAKNVAPVAKPVAMEVEKSVGKESSGGGGPVAESILESVGKNRSPANIGKELSEEDAQQLFSIIFGDEVTKDILAQWSNQGIRFSPDPETSMGLVQHEGGPCGVLAALQAFVLKDLLFNPEVSGYVASAMTRNMELRRGSQSESTATDIFSLLTEERKSRALMNSMCEILFLCGDNERAVLASIGVLHGDERSPEDNSKDDVIAKLLEGVAIDSGPDLQNVLRVEVHTSKNSAIQRLETMLPIFRSRMGAILFLISALLSRGMDSVQGDRDDPSQPLVTAPFGHASQEIVNLLLSGKAVANVFDGRMDLGGGMFVKGISSAVEVGFLTLLESLNFCKVGHCLKCPKWPIWVVGSESHYTVLFALDTKVQEENEYESRETQIRRAFDAQDQSGGGGFISVEGFHQVLRDTGINLPVEKVNNLCSTGFIVWSEFWQVLLDLDKSLGGLKDASGLMGKKVFDLYHFNGIAKSVINGSHVTFGIENPVQRPRLTKLRVSVPPKWTPEEYMSNVTVSSSSGNSETGGKNTDVEVSKPEPSQHAPLVDCIRTRWPRATCNWDGDAPSIV